MSSLALTTKSSDDPLVAALRDFAERPFEQARAMPAAAYTSKRMLAAETQAIFRREWICAGRAEALAEKGGYDIPDTKLAAGLFLGGVKEALYWPVMFGGKPLGDDDEVIETLDAESVESKMNLRQ